MPKQKIKQGECVLSKAAEMGLPWKVIWEHPDNADLKAKRELPNVLYPGDRLFIPAPTEKRESAASEQKHQFKAIRPKTVLRLRLVFDGEPIANKKCLIKVGEKRIRGTTNAEGDLEVPIEPSVTEATLTIGNKPPKYSLKIGYLDPLDTTSGLQARLGNLGFDAGEVDDDWGKQTRTGMRAFQERQELSMTEKPDDPTRDRLRKEFGS